MASFSYLHVLVGRDKDDLPHGILFNLPFILALPILCKAPSFMFVFILVEHTVRNDWIHMNVAWKEVRLAEMEFRDTAVSPVFFIGQCRSIMWPNSVRCSRYGIA